MANPNPSPATRFKPGNRANPGGRPKGRSLTSRLREALEAELPNGKQRADALINELILLALGRGTGDRQAIKDIFDRVDGKVPDIVIAATEEDDHGPTDEAEAALDAAAEVRERKRSRDEPDE